MSVSQKKCLICGIFIFKFCLTTLILKEHHQCDMNPLKRGDFPCGLEQGFGNFTYWPHMLTFWGEKGRHKVEAIIYVHKIYLR